MSENVATTEPPKKAARGRPRSVETRRRILIAAAGVIKERGFADPYFSNSTEAQIGPRTVVDYTSSVVVTDEAKSNRYTAPTGS